ncbi:MAG TPA: MotA/TolQ/ExbB proton channel family protein [Pseudomonadales bacterium]
MSRARHGWGSDLSALLIASLALLPVASTRAAETDPEEAAAQAEAKARAEAEARQREIDRAFANLQEQIRKLRAEEAEINRQREAAARADLEEQQRLERQAVNRRNAAEARSKELDRQWEANSKRIEEISALLAQHQGNLGELFGVTRQVAGDAAGVLGRSLLSAQFNPSDGVEERAEFMRRLAGAKALPSINELERLWYELMRELVGTGKVVRFNTPVLQLDGNAVEQEVVRVGPFTAVSGDRFLGYLPSKGMLTELDGQLAPRFRYTAQRLVDTPADAHYVRAVVDPASGALLGLYLQRPSWIERIESGEIVGYVIIAVGVIGALVGLFQIVYLLRTQLAVSSQVRNLEAPRADNPLGRLILAFRGNDQEPVSADLAELRVSEAVLREVPKLERFQSFLRLAVAAGPLLGLIGTVVGMIITFHAIVASGGSDPKLMAHGIGQAMIATVLGLGVAIPLLFLNSALSAMSRNVTQVLDERSQALLAEQIAGNG